MDERWYLFFGLFVLVIVYADGAACGNAVLEEGEFCDTNRISSNCTNFNYTGGSLLCLDDCFGYDYSQCTGEEVCGNGIISEGEICESGNLRGRTCLDEGYEGGDLKCRNDCVKYDYKECTGVKSVCGDGNITGKEECDGTVSKSCTDLGYDSGILRCNNNCTFNLGYCFKDITVDEKIGENNISESLELNESVFENTANIPGEINNEKIKLGNVLVIFLVLTVAGVFGIYFYVFKTKK